MRKLLCQNCERELEVDIDYENDAVYTDLSESKDPSVCPETGGKHSPDPYNHGLG